MRLRFPGGYRSHPRTRNSLRTLLPTVRVQQSEHVQPVDTFSRQTGGYCAARDRRPLLSILVSRRRIPGVFHSGKLWRMQLNSSAPVAVCDAHEPRGGSWGDQQVRQVLADGSQPERILINTGREVAPARPSPCQATKKFIVGHVYLDDDRRADLRFSFRCVCLQVPVQPFGPGDGSRKASRMAPRAQLGWRRRSTAIWHTNSSSTIMPRCPRQAAQGG